MIGRSISVEFLGVPGVGKTRISRRVAEILRGGGLPVKEPTYSLGHGPGRPRSLYNSARKSVCVAREVLTHPIYSLVSLGAICATRQRSFRVLFKMAFNWLMLSSLLRRVEAVPAVYLFDQGIFQALWSTGLEARPGAIGDMGRVVLERVPLPDVVAVLEAQLATIVDRLSSRGGHESRADAWRPEDTEVFARSLAMLEQIKDYVRDVTLRRAKPLVILVQNDADADLETNALRLAAEIERLAGEWAA